MSKCNCVSEIDKRLAEQCTNTRIKVPFIIEPDLSLSGSKLEIVTEKIDTKKRGRPTSLFTSYCPSCGVKHER